MEPLSITAIFEQYLAEDPLFAQYHNRNAFGLLSSKRVWKINSDDVGSERCWLIKHHDFG